MIKKLAKAFGLPSLLYLLGVGLYHPPDWSGPDFLGARLAGLGRDDHSLDWLAVGAIF